MPLLFTCPHCETRTLVEDQFAGQAGACASCGKPITVPEVQEDGSIGDAPKQKNTQRIRTIASIAVSVVVLSAGAFLLFKYGIEGVAQMQANATRNGCRQNASQIATALNAYADDYGSYPTPVVKDKNGKALYSWRVLILPYIGMQGQYDQFKLDEPWDSESNMQIAYNRPALFASPAADGYGWGETNYMLITGPGTLFPATGPLSLDDIADRPQQTLLVVEVARPSGARESYWTQPSDLDISKMTPSIGTNDGVEIGGNHEDGATAATCDGRSHFLPATLTTGQIRALITPAGGEPLRDDLLDVWEQ